MVNHSFGGVVGCSAVNGFTATNRSKLTGSGKVIGIIQMAALTVPTGVSLLEFLQKGKGSDIKPIGLSGGDGWDNMKRDVVEAMYHDLEPEDGKYWASRILKHSSATRSSSENVYAGWKDVPVCYLKCTDDRASDPGTQAKMIESIKEANPNVIVKEIFASHSPMLSKPQETAELVDEAAKWFLGFGS
jgi:pimeloyl-ACP methyl ester carboxylesterase